MIDVRDLHFSYARSTGAAVRGVSFAVGRGEIFGFLGPSGAGKSTTQKILVGLLEGYRGRVRVREKEVLDWTADDYERIGVSFETPNHFSKLTGLENLRYFAALYREATRDPAGLLSAVGLESDGDRLVGQYSKGMKCRLSIARCLLQQPSVRAARPSSSPRTTWPPPTSCATGSRSWSTARSPASTRPAP